MQREASSRTPVPVPRSPLIKKIEEDVVANRGSGSRERDDDILSASMIPVAVQQIANLVESVTRLTPDIAPDGLSFEAQRSAGPACDSGILKASATLAGDGLVLNFDVGLVNGAPRGEILAIWSSLSGLPAIADARTRLLPPTVDPATGETKLTAEVQVKAQPLSPSRVAVLGDLLAKLDGLAKQLTDSVPVLAPAARAAAWKEFAAVVDVVESWDCASEAPELFDWAFDQRSVLDAGLTLSIETATTVEESAAVSALAAALEMNGGSLARLTAPAIGSRELLELVRRAPPGGIVAVGSASFSLSGSAYELGSEVTALMTACERLSKRLVFTGTHDDHQKVFAQQGAKPDPLRPVIAPRPYVSLEALTKFCARDAGRRSGGLSKIEESQVTVDTLNELSELPGAQRKRLAMIATQVVLSGRGNSGGISRARRSEVTKSLAGRTATLSGLGATPDARRSALVDAHFNERLTHPDLRAFLLDRLLGQDEAVHRLVEHLGTEALTRDWAQPIRWLAVGPPATGKSDSAMAIAEWLGLPHVPVDLGKAADVHSVLGALIGAARGIVNSFEAGLLEKAGREPRGCVMEWSDVDHANPAIRAKLLDILLRALQAGLTENQKGQTFVVSSIIFCVTANLSDGRADETIFAPMGFASSPNQNTVKSRVQKELSHMLSEAFLSRGGSPIVFRPLDSGALVAIVERSLMTALMRACQRKGLGSPALTVEPGLVKRLAVLNESRVSVHGARCLDEVGRQLAASALIRALEAFGVDRLRDAPLRLSASAGSKLLIEPTA